MYRRLIFMAVIALMVSTANAGVFYFENEKDNGDWADPCNWVGGSLPTSSDSVYLDNAYTAPTLGSPYANIAAAYEYVQMWVGDQNDVPFTLDIDSGGALTMTYQTLIGSDANGTGIVNIINGGSMHCSDASGDPNNVLHIGAGGVSGTINLISGTFTSDVNTILDLDTESLSALNVSGGTANMNGSTFSVGYGSPLGDAEINVTGSGQLNVPNAYLNLSNVAGNTSKLTVNGGTVTLGQALNTSLVVGSHGVVDVQSGTLNLDAGALLGLAGTSEFYLSGGQVNSSGGGFYVANNGDATLEISGGTLNSLTDSFFVGNDSAPPSSTALVQVSNGGVLNAGYGLYVGGNSDSIGILEVNSGGTVNYTDTPPFWCQIGNGASGLLRVNSGGLFDGDDVYIYDRMEVNGGTFRSDLLYPYKYPGWAEYPTVTLNSGLIETTLLYMYGSTPVIHVNGGTFRATGSVHHLTNLNVSGGLFEGTWMLLGTYSVGSIGTINLSGGTIDVDRLDIGQGFEEGIVNVSGGKLIADAIYASYPSGFYGTLNVTGGLVDVTVLQVGFYEDGELQLDGGIIDCEAFTLGGIVTTGLMDVSFGILKANGYLVADLQAAETAGDLTVFANTSIEAFPGTLQLDYYPDDPNITYVYTNVDYIVVDSMESYSGTINATWLASGTAVISDVPSPAHDGSSRSMQLVYANGAGQTADVNSFTPFEDWTLADSNTLTLFVYGNAGNTGSTALSVTLDDGTSQDTQSAPISFTTASWQRVDIPLEDFAVDQSDVIDITLTVSGTGAGTINIDNIRLYNYDRCVHPGMPGDYNYDCRVDRYDYAILANGWTTEYDLYDLDDVTEAWLNEY